MFFNFNLHVMIENLINNLKSQVGEQILGQTNLGGDKLDGIFSIIGDVAKKEVSQQMLGGGLSSVMNLFSDKPNSESANMLQSNITSGVIGKLISKLGLSEGMANTIANIAIPSLIGLITKKNNETPDDDPSPLNEIFGDKRKGLGGALGGILGKIFR